MIKYKIFFIINSYIWFILTECLCWLLQKSFICSQAMVAFDKWIIVTSILSYFQYQFWLIFPFTLMCKSKVKPQRQVETSEVFKWSKQTLCFIIMFKYWKNISQFALIQWMQHLQAWDMYVQSTLLTFFPSLFKV